MTIPETPSPSARAGAVAERARAAAVPRDHGGAQLGRRAQHAAVRPVRADGVVWRPVCPTPALRTTSTASGACAVHHPARGITLCGTRPKSNEVGLACGGRGCVRGVWRRARVRGTSARLLCRGSTLLSPVLPATTCGLACGPGVGVFAARARTTPAPRGCCGDARSTTRSAAQRQARWRPCASHAAGFLDN